MKSPFSVHCVARYTYRMAFCSIPSALPVVSTTEGINIHLVIGKIEDKNRHLAMSLIGVRIGKT